ncbi:hypothetical protein ACP70R_032466 [Stipagrostis hirtigluma subsp. patula]
MTRSQIGAFSCSNGDFQPRDGGSSIEPVGPFFPSSSGERQQLLQQRLAVSSSGPPRRDDGLCRRRQRRTGAARARAAAAWSAAGNMPPGAEPLPEDAPRLGETDPAGPPMPTTSRDKIGGATAGDGAPGGSGMPETTPAPAVPLAPVSPDGSNV